MTTTAEIAKLFPPSFTTVLTVIADISAIYIINIERENVLNYEK